MYKNTFHKEKREERKIIQFSQFKNIYSKVGGYSQNVLQKTFPKKSYTCTLSTKV
jgi:hypothetical protein